MSPDYLNFLSKITPAKAFNALKVLSSFYLSRLLKKPKQWGLPITVSIEPTTSCNLRCPECPSGLRSFTRVTGMLDNELYKSTVDQMQDHLLYLYFYFQGEPYLHPQFLNLVKYASKKNIYTVTSTNAHFLDDEKAKATVESGLDRIIISIDGTTQETYESYRVGGKLEKVIAGTKNLLKWKKALNSKSPHVIFQFLVVRPNEHQIDDLYKLANKLGVDEVKLKTAQIYDYEKGNPLIPSQDQYSRYRKNGDGKYHLKNELQNRCWKLWHASVVTWNGKIVPCCFDKDAQHVMGDLTKESFREIWKGKRYAAFRTALLASRSQIDICKNCSEGLTVWA